MFNNATLFNSDISGWDTSNAISTIFMFNNCTSLNQDLSGWDVSNVQFFTSMFSYASVFNSDLSGWNGKRLCSCCRAVFFVSVWCTSPSLLCS